MSLPRKPRPKTKNRPRKPIQPRLDIQGVIARNEEYLTLMHSLEAMLPRVTTNRHAMDLAEEIIHKLEYIPPNLGSLNAHDKYLASKATELFLALQKDWANIQDVQTKQALKGYMGRLDKMAADLGASRAAPRNMKEVLARNFLGLQPQDVRTKGLLKTYMKEAAMDMRVLFGGNAEEMMQDQRRSDHRAQNEAEARKDMRRDHEEALHDDADFEQRKVNAVHEEALREDRERNRQKERDKAHEEAIEEDRKRNTATASGVPFVTDAVRDKELIHAQALEINEKVEKEREELRLVEKEKKKAQQKEGRAVEAHVENRKDDSIAAALLGEVKAIHGLLKKGGGGGTGGGTGKGRKRATPTDADNHEAEIQKIMKTLGYSANDPEGRRLAEKALKKGVRTGGAAVTPEILEKDHDHALKVNADIDRKAKEQNYVRDKEEAHTKALEIEKRIEHIRALRTNERMDKKAKETGLLPNTPQLQEAAFATNQRMDAISAAKAQNASMQSGTSTPSIAPAAPAPPPPSAPTATGSVGGGGIMGRVRRFGAGIKNMAGMAVGASGMATGAVALGGLALGGAVGHWANKNLGLKSKGERMNEAAEAHAAEVEKNSHRVAREKGYQSFETMREANRSRAQFMETEKVRRASVESLERPNIDESMLEPVAAPTVVPVVNNYHNNASASPSTPPQPQTVFIRAVHPSFMRYQEKRMSRILHPQGVV